MSFKDWSAAQTKASEKTATKKTKSPAPKATEAVQSDGPPADTKAAPKS
jgi:hypothetical protein